MYDDLGNKGNKKNVSTGEGTSSSSVLRSLAEYDSNRPIDPNSKRRRRQQTIKASYPEDIRILMDFYNRYFLPYYQVFQSVIDTVTHSDAAHGHGIFRQREFQMMVTRLKNSYQRYLENEPTIAPAYLNESLNQLNERYARLIANLTGYQSNIDYLKADKMLQQSEVSASHEFNESVSRLIFFWNQIKTTPSLDDINEQFKTKVQLMRVALAASSEKREAETVENTIQRTYAVTPSDTLSSPIHTKRKRVKSFHETRRRHNPTADGIGAQRKTSLGEELLGYDPEVNTSSLKR